ncbi:MAG: glycosyltransferase family 2 protein [Clostridia bacterium]|jgi:glycosyltransferase involved in cell wall biosynthesis|nr:glycosyltransferase family 2 protein [Clostridia bacterium]
MMKISVLIPAYNEEDRIEKTVLALSNIRSISQILVVDDGSQDKTAQVAESAGATVVSLEINVGKGAALNHGAKFITGDIVCLLDADLGSSAGEASKLINPIIAGEADLTIGTFPKKRKKAGFGLVKKLASWGIKANTGQIFTEPLSGQRAFTKDAFALMLPFADGYGVEVMLTIKALKRGLRVVEVETAMTHKETGRDTSGFWHRGKQFVHVLKALLVAKGLRYD